MVDAGPKPTYEEKNESAPLMGSSISSNLSLLNGFKLAFVLVGFCPSGLLSQWAFVLVGFCPVGFCPSGLLS